MPSAHGARNHTRCDSLLLGPNCGAHTFPYLETRNPGATVEHEASTSRISEDQLFYCQQRGSRVAEDAVNMIVGGFCREVFKELPMEFAVEAQNLLAVTLEGSCRMSAPLLQIEELAVSVAGTPVLRGVTLAVHVRRGARHHGAQRLRQEHPRARAGRAAQGYEVTGGSARFDGLDLLSHGSGRACARRLVPGVPVSGGNPRRVTNAYLLKTALNACRRQRGEPDVDAFDFLDDGARARCAPCRSTMRCWRAASTKGSPAARRNATRSCRCWYSSHGWHCSTRPIPAWTSTPSRWSAAASTACARRKRAVVLVTHYQRLLDHVVPDKVHVLARGRIVRSGDRELALELERRGYDWLLEAVPEVA